MILLYQISVHAHHFMHLCCPPTTPAGLSWGKLFIKVKAQKGCDKAKIPQTSEGGLLLQVTTKGTKDYNCQILNVCKRTKLITFHISATSSIFS